MELTNRTYGVGIETLISTTIGIPGVVAAIRAAGVPCQYAGYTHATTSYWKVVTDCSVGGTGLQGLEVVSPILRGQDGLDQIAKVCAALASVGCKINQTCGLHVHHGASDYKARHFENLVTLYHKAERALDSVVTPSRRESRNTYCKSTIGASVATLRSDRYHKLNLVSYLTHGTIEVRHHQGTIEAEKIQNWVVLTQGMIERAKRAVTPSAHSITLYDLLQAAGIIHNAAQAAVRSYFYARQAHFAACAA